MARRRIAGIDGCRAGWLCVTLDAATGNLTGALLAELEDILTAGAVPDVIAIDIPMGLPERGPRACEKEARKLLAWPASSSIFPVPSRPLLRARDYQEACRLGERVDGRKLSRQAWGIVPKIREADAFLRANPGLRGRIWEVHPEVSFRAWAGVVLHGKKSAEGRAEREKLVTARFGERVQAARAGVPAGGWATDDFLDAFACLWTAQRIAERRSVTMPSAPPVDRFGLRMAISF